jgi:hypothetical protein
LRPHGRLAFIDHDALSQLTCGATIEWMKDTYGPTRNGEKCSYYDRWLLPELGLNEGTAYAGRPVGNHSEHMPWDSSLNKDVDDCVNRHCILTDAIEKNEEGEYPPEKFSCYTPRLQDHAYERVFNAVGSNVGAPLGHRIVRDFEKCYGSNLVIICKALGWAVDGCGNRNGKRNHSSYFGPDRESNRGLVPNANGHGGVRVAGAGKKEKLWLHEDVKGAVAAKAENAERAHKRQRPKESFYLPNGTHCEWDPWFMVV